ncbi:MAG: hypothetical protein HOA37_00880 [Flavobacteriales bacterium]|nr:hypothetical protein [Flavobacteriales bacterium]MBT6915804.1 hypothetical protein [Flavobacteriales bacterium]
MIRNLVISLSLILAFGLELSAQAFKEFAGEDVFLEELEAQMVERAVGDAKKTNKELHEQFTEMWVELNVLNPSQKTRIFNASNTILKRRLAVIPGVRDYIVTVMDIANSPLGLSAFEEWHRTVDAILELRSVRKEFARYMDFSAALFSDNVVYKSPSVQWISDSPNFSFQLEDGKPKLIFPELNLKCEAKRSDGHIKNTSGVYYPLDGKWIGKNGLVTWERAGLDPNKVYAIINEYDMLMKFSNFDADSVTFYNTDYFDTPLLGRLEDKVQANVTPENASFPYFISYSKRLRIANIDRGVDYEGGFSQKGARFIASGSEKDPAILVFHLNDKPFLEVNSMSFSIKDDRIISTNAAIRFSLHEDSIYHPGLDFKYFRKDRIVNLYKADEGLQKAPYFDSYHGIDIHTELVQWKIDQPRITFGTIPNSSDNRAMFESDFYFRAGRFDQLMALSMNHPMVMIKNCFEEKEVDVLTDREVASCMHSSLTDAQVTLLNYTNLGLVKYNIKTGKVRSTDRLYHYVRAKSEKEDYDVIQIASDIGTMENASLDLVDEVFKLKMNGIRNITVSDSHQVVIYPKDGTITMKKDKDFDFSGVVRAGRLEYFGNNFEFLYNDFKMEMPNIDSIRLIVSTDQKTAGGKERLARVSTVIEDVEGTLEIDHPKNKSGLEELEQYPIFTSHKKSYVYYDRSSIQNKAYHRDNFYFELDPFVFDSLDNFENRRIDFEGRFVSADIFPEFRESLTLQEDYSLGFIRNTPKDGFDVYRGKGEYHDTIKLSHDGLRGSGKLKYLTSTSKSDNFLFLPEEMKCIAQSLVIDEQMGQVEYPPATGKDIIEDWHPYDDNMHLETDENPFVMYDGSELTGSLDLSPEELQGAGLFAFDKAELESESFHFNFSGFDSDTADFKLLSEVSTFEGLQFRTNNVEAHVDFAKRKGVFISNDGTSMMEFPNNQYVAFMDRFTWYMDQEAIELSGGKADKSNASGAMQYEGSRFISVHPDQDSLEFYSPAARYDLRRSIIKAKEVEFIQVADALIYPDSGFITVRRRAKMKTLTNARIVANAITKYHKIDSATIDIFAKREYVGTGLYTYKDAKGNKQRIRFHNINVDSTDQTYAKGDISTERNFTLSPYFDYKGKVRLNASVKDLTFNGMSRIKHQCEASVSMQWFKFKAAIDPDDIFIPVDKTTFDKDDNLLKASLVLDPDTGAIYTTFMSPKLEDKDYDLLPATGFLTYNTDGQEYRISNINKLAQQTLPGQYLSLDAEDCKVFGEGKLGFGFNPGQVDISTVGNMKHDLSSNGVDLDVMLVLDFFFVDKAIDDMAKIMQENAMGEPISFERETYQRGLGELIGTDEADRLISQITLIGQFKKFPSDLEKHFFLTDVQMKWNAETNSYQSVGDKIGIGNIGKRQINVKVKGKLEVVVGRIPEINLYLEADNDTWYYFKYSRNIMQAYSSMDDFNTAIGDLKADKRKKKVEKGQSPYSFMLSSKRRRDDFVTKF